MTIAQLLSYIQDAFLHLLYETYRSYQLSVWGCFKAATLHFILLALVLYPLRGLILRTINSLFEYDKYLKWKYTYLQSQEPGAAPKTAASAETATSSVAAQLLDLFHVLWAAILVLTFIPYSRMENAWTWYCYYAYAWHMVFTLLLLRKSDRLHAFLITWVLSPMECLMVLTNGSWVYYGLINEGFSTYNYIYFWSHFGPPLFIWIWILVKRSKLMAHDESINPLTRGFWHCVFILHCADVLHTIYVFTFHTEAVYKVDVMALCYVFGSFIPNAVVVALLVLMLVSTRYLQRQEMLQSLKYR